MPRRRAAVVVLGDLGRSPRMQYHALSLAEQAEMEVDVVAYQGTAPREALLQHECIHLHLQAPPWVARLPRALYLLAMPFKVLCQVAALLWTLCVSIPSPDVILLQNPPTIPAFTVVQIACWLRGSAMIIDWHNFGYTLLGLSLGPSHPFVRFYRWYERRFGRYAAAHLCVTKAMQMELAQNWGIQATVLYDRPPDFFRPASLGERHSLFTRLHHSLTHPEGMEDCLTGSTVAIPSQAADISTADSDTLVTSCSGREVRMREERPAVVVSSTSWTEDEDFDVLLQAGVMYDMRVQKLLGEQEEGGAPSTSGQMYPRILFIITGKGPMRAMYEERMRRLRLKRVAFRTLWLAAEDYPRLLGAADLGVCLHTSSSGLDLPMKVVDMFGCGLPVCARAYSCIGELVKERQNGLLFSSPSELADQLLDLFKDFPAAKEGALLQQLVQGAATSGNATRWDEEWDTSVSPLLRSCLDNDRNNANRGRRFGKC